MTIRIAVIGAGFCGTMIACELARASVPEELVIALIDDRSQFARGVAYQTNDEGWLLNARAIQLGAVGGQPGDFSRFCRDIGIEASAETFVPRAVYGAYLEDLLDKTSTSMLRNRLYRVYARADSIESAARDGKALLRLGNGETMLADHVILATGPVSRSAAVPTQMRDLGNHYLHDPWDLRRLYDARPGSTFALLGTGLTALDVISSLRRRVPLARFHLLSRRGLLPRSHASGPNVRPDIDLAGLLRARVRGSARHCMREIRAIAAYYQQEGGDWRDVIDAMRPQVSTLWQSWSVRDKARFVEHAAPYWEVHRHRCPVSTSHMIDQLWSDRRLVVDSARLEKAWLQDDEIKLQVRRRHARQSTQIQADYLINCTGPSLQASQSPLLAQLQRIGLASDDAFGLRVDDEYRLIGAGQRPVDWLSYVGPLLKGKFWEATAIPELRDHVERLVSRLKAQWLEHEAALAG